MDAMTEKASPRIVGAGNYSPVRLMNAGLDERSGEIVAHGWLDIESIGQLRVGPYQREVLSKIGGKKTSLLSAVESGARLPDIMLGMRGQNYDTKGHSMILSAPVYVIDGLQRVSALKQFAELYPAQAKALRIGAEVRFGTDQESEEALFMVLNTSRIPVSPNVILRNLRNKFPSIATLYGLSTADRDFPFYGRVQWGQRMAKGDLATALMLTKTAYVLHASSNWRTGRAGQLASALDVKAKEIGLPTFRANMKTFAEVLDECFKVKHVEYRDAATHLKGNFLFCLARLFCEHGNFWNGDKLVVSAGDRKKIATFPVMDPEVTRLAASGTMAMGILYEKLVEKFNTRKRIGRLQKRMLED